MSGDVLTPNAKLTEVQPSRPNWSEAMNNNLILIDAIIGSYFTVNQLQGIWKNSTVYVVNDAVVDSVSGVVYKCLIENTSPASPTTFSQDRTNNPSFWGGYTSPARSRGVWMANGTSYTINDFVVSGAQYAICVQNNVSAATFSADVASGYWSILIDLSSVGTSVLPVPGGLGDANKFVVVTPSGNGYTIISVAQAQQNLGGTTVGIALFTASSTAAALTALGAQPAGSYQPRSSNLDSLAAGTLGAFGVSILASALQSDARTALGLSTAAFLAVGTSANNVVQLDASAKLPAVDASQLLNLPAATAAFTTGDGKITLKTAPDSGWVILDDGTIGSSTSGASNRANADCQALFTLVWNNVSNPSGNADCPVVGGIGLSAAADWAANKKITLLTSLGRTLGVAGAGSGLTTRALGHTTGAETVAVPLKNHTHGAGTLAFISNGDSGGGGVVPYNPVGDGIGSSRTATLNSGVTASSGDGAAPTVSTIQPTTFWNVMLKL